MSSSNNVVQIPTAQEIEEAKLSSRTLSKYADADRVHLSIKGSNDQSDELVLPGHALQLLLDVLSEMSRGNAIGIMPIHAELSTQDAANILNVSRPFLVGLLEKGEIDFHKVGTHRRVLAKNVFDYKQRIDTERMATLDQLAVESQKLGMGYE